MSASSQLRLRLRLRLPGSALPLGELRRTAREPQRPESGRVGRAGRAALAPRAPGVKLRPSLGSRENLLKLREAQGEDREAGDGTGLVLKAIGGFPTPTPDPGLDGARCLEKGFVVVLPIEQKETGLEVALLTSARTKFGSLAAFLSVYFQCRELKSASGSA